MNPKLILVLLGFFGSYSYADCTKQEVMKLVDEGLSKIEIKMICAISMGSGLSKEKIIRGKWITPSPYTCSVYGGILYNELDCAASWQNAKFICRDSGGRLPNISELKSVVRNSLKDNHPFDYYKRKGFHAYLEYYWSDTTYDPHPIDACVMRLGFSVEKYERKNNKNFVNCVKQK